METHPCTAFIHVSLEGLALRRVFGTRVEKQHYLILSQDLVLQFIPVRCRLEREIGLRCHLLKPWDGLVHKADMGAVVLARVKSDHVKRRGRGLGLQIQTTESQYGNYPCKPSPEP